MFKKLNWKVRTGQKVSEVRFLDFLCYNMTTHGRKSLKNFEFLNFEFPYQSYGSFSFCCFLMEAMLKFYFVTILLVQVKDFYYGVIDFEI